MKPQWIFALALESAERLAALGCPGRWAAIDRLMGAAFNPGGMFEAPTAFECFLLALRDPGGLRHADFLNFLMCYWSKLDRELLLLTGRTRMQWIDLCCEMDQRARDIEACEAQRVQERIRAMETCPDRIEIRRLAEEGRQIAEDAQRLFQEREARRFVVDGRPYTYRELMAANDSPAVWEWMNSAPVGGTYATRASPTGGVRAA